jgi:ribosomal protein L16
MGKIIKQPRRVVFQKCYKGRPSNSKVISCLNWGSMGIRSCELARVSSLQLGVAIRFLFHYLPRGAQVITRVFPDKPISASSAGTRIGKGKGEFSFWGSYVKKGHIIFELWGVRKIAGSLAFRIIKTKLPFIRTLVFRRLPLK